MLSHNYIHNNNHRQEPEKEKMVESLKQQSLTKGEKMQSLKKIQKSERFKKLQEIQKIFRQYRVGGMII